MIHAADLTELIVTTLASYATHERMPAIAVQAGLHMQTDSNGLSKRDRVKQALLGKSVVDLAEIARKLGVVLNSFELEEAGLAILEESTPAITEITRRDIALCFGDEFCSPQHLLSTIQKFFPIGSEDGGFLGPTLADNIYRHMVRNPGDWDVEDLFSEIGALRCSRDRFSRLVETSLHPLIRRGEEQTSLAAALNDVLRRDGYQLVPDGSESGYPILCMRPMARGPSGTPKNLIFASNGPKPEIGFRDAINNDIVILSNEASCLVYEREILPLHGVAWSALVAWWSEHPEGCEDAPAHALGKRLRASLASDAERSLFDNYFKLYRNELGENLPALIPQVYLHYDPAVVRNLRHRAGLVRQRMDFLLLLPNNQRIVIEVDGSQHFSQDGKPSISLYAEMVAADRDLRLGGYEVYRFGANELVGDGAAKLIKSFFDRLWLLHVSIRKSH